jgi:hypothetical protein
MKLFLQNFSSHGRAFFMLLLLFLFAAALNIQAQDVRDSSAVDDRETPVKQDPAPVAVHISERTDQSAQSHQSAELYMRSTADKNMRRWLLSEPANTSGSLAPAQGSTNGTYVFPTKKERFKRYVWDTIGPWTLLAVAAAAGIDHWAKNPPEWGQGASGYGKRYASDLGQNAIQQTTSYGLSEAFRLDSSFTNSSRSGFGPRLEDALLENVTSRTRKGKRIISVPRLAGFYVGGIVATEAWYPSRFNYKDGLREGTYALLFGFATNVFEEFILHR